ncbi:oligosaccharide flippase family protein [Sorangium sp. So ce295]|uniref:oligosaccharide flippase family protein n=1 Tax=Sorangium sp. So ce295 TaxID=3133295 RepID=UPI003F5F0CD4
MDVPATAEDPRTSLLKRASRGAAWSVAGSTISRIIALAGTFVLMRWISTVEYGSLAVATSLVLSAQYFSNIGVGTYIIANPSAGRDIVFHATIIHLLAGVVALGSLVLLLDPLARVFDTSELSMYIPGLVFAALVERVAAMPERVLARQLRFGVITRAGVLGELSFTAASVTLGVLGFGAMSLVAANVVRAVLKATHMIATLGFRDWIEPHPLRRETLNRLLRYGFAVSLGNWASFATRRWDNLLMARLHGPVILGYYDRAYTLAEVPATYVAERIMDVLTASFPQIDATKRPAALLRVVRLLALIMFPMALGLGAIAESLAAAILPPHLGDVAPFLLVLAGFSLAQPIGAAMSVFFQAQLRPRTIAKVEWVTLILMLLLVFALGHITPVWAAGGVGLAYGARYLLYLMFLKRDEGVAILPFVGALLPPLAACVIMFVGIFVFRRGFVSFSGASAGIQLCAEIAFGAAVYVAALLLLARDASRDLLAMARGLRRG